MARGASRRIAIVVAVIMALLLAWLPGAFCSPGGPAEDEPPGNPYLADSPWAVSHRNPYCQASTPLPGPTKGKGLEYTHRFTGFDVPVNLQFSSAYPDGKRAIWASTVVAFGHSRVLKLEPDNLAVIDDYNPMAREGAPFKVGSSVSGAYSVLDRDGNFFVPSWKGCGIDAFGDRQPGVSGSSISLRKRFLIPDERLLRPGVDGIVGMTMTYDGMVAFATRFGTVGVVGRDLSAASARYLSLNEGVPADTPDDQLEQVSNSIAADESGGIYVVTDRKLYRVQWSGSALSIRDAEGGWCAAYDAGTGEQAGRLGKGSGATPTVMGTGNQDKFIVITDGQKLMHLVLFWKDGIPSDWQPVAPGKDRRMAAEVPVTFGDPGATESNSEQSVLVRGYGAVVVNNDLRCSLLDALPQALQPFSMLFSNIPWIAPYGIEKFEWDPASRTCRSRWANRKVSLPNAIPCMSSSTGLVYCVGQRFGFWTLEAIDWRTGKSRFRRYLSPWPWDNSFYAATEIGPDGAIYYGTLSGVTRLKPRP